MPPNSSCGAISMQVLWLPLILLYWASGASAANCAPQSGTATITTADDVTNIRQCTEFSGNITVANSGLTDLNLDGLETVSGNILIAGAGALSSVSSTTLQSVSSLTLENLSNLRKVYLPKIRNITTLHLATLPALKDCVITAGYMVQDVRGVIVLDTALETLDWLTWPASKSMTIAANLNLANFTIPYSRIGTGSSYAISINNAMKELDFSALTAIDGSLEINGNGDKNVSFDRLSSINGFARISGAFKSLTMPVLKEINGALKAQATNDGNIINFCDWLSTQSHMQGHYECIGNATNPIAASQTSAAPSIATPTSSSVTADVENKERTLSTGLSTGAKIGIAVSIFLAAVISSAATFWFFRRHTRSKLQEIEEVNDKKRRSSSTIDHELDGVDARVEIGPAAQRYELPEQETRQELEGNSLQELDGGPMHGKERGMQRKEGEIFELPA